jgi:hypothetical protein
VEASVGESSRYATSTSSYLCFLQHGYVFHHCLGLKKWHMKHLVNLADYGVQTIVGLSEDETTSKA